jgi:hypothetical protein
VNSDRIQAPSNKLCHQLVKAKKLKPFPATGYTQTDIYDEKGKLLTECFAFPSQQLNLGGPYGWCATCNRDAKPGQPGVNSINVLAAFAHASFLSLNFYGDIESYSS